MKTVLYYSKRNKDVPLISTLHRNDAMSTREEKNPSADLDYNRNKGGVDNLEKCLELHSQHLAECSTEAGRLEETDVFYQRHCIQ
ncbi:piggyBac transposable element-derived protein 4-like protein [Lates japonicus]|uniref:PiggyBac transposable element-derived protein 4-like protein n=1 Tax=Lates japonicus TaxID=270547 RepID=A0AAD3NG87_LATJO|nr:piggyBac transposable element-derived protein 4-like protein [Lates japonicus]